MVTQKNQNRNSNQNSTIPDGVQLTPDKITAAKAAEETRLAMVAETKRLSDEKAKADADKAIADAKIAADKAIADAEAKIASFVVGVPEKFLAKGPDGKYLDRIVGVAIQLQDRDILDQHVKELTHSADLEILAAPVVKASKINAFCTEINSDPAIIAGFEAVIAKHKLSIEELVDIFVHTEFPGGKVVIKASPKQAATKVGKETGKTGESLKSHGKITDTSSGVTYDSAHVMACTLKIKYLGTGNVKDEAGEKVLGGALNALVLSLRYDSGVYLKPDGTPVLKANGSIDNEDDYIKTPEMAASLGISLSGCNKSGKRYHPFFYILTEKVSVVNGTTVKSFVAEKRTRNVDILGNVVAS